jgi:hypothetical protein
MPVKITNKKIYFRFPISLSYLYLFPSCLPYCFPIPSVRPVIIPFPLPSSLSFTLKQFPHPQSIPLFLSYLYLLPTLPIPFICPSYCPSSPHILAKAGDCFSQYPSNSTPDFPQASLELVIIYIQTFQLFLCY